MRSAPLFSWVPSGVLAATCGVGTVSLPMFSRNPFSLSGLRTELFFRPRESQALLLIRTFLFSCSRQRGLLSALVDLNSVRWSDISLYRRTHDASPTEHGESFFCYSPLFHFSRLHPVVEWIFLFSPAQLGRSIFFSSGPPD